MDGTLYFECTSGISGDMAVAAMLDLGVDQERLIEGIRRLGLKGYRISVRDVERSGIRAKDFAVVLDHDNHDHDPDYLYGSGAHAEEHHHGHRTYADMIEIFRRGGLSPRAYGFAVRIATILAEAESEAHGVPMSEVHFHEVGAIDSIIDIAALAICMDELDVRDVCFSDLYEGTGTIRCQHGVIPVPAPAVANIARVHSLPLVITGSKGEYVTPTGAAFAAAVRTCELPGSFTISSIGIGAGKRPSERTGILRAMLIRPRNGSETVVKLECNVDDCTGEALGFAMERLFAAGAREVNYSPVYMKKNRPAWLLTVICKESEREALEDVIFRETTTIGIRRCVMERTKLDREMITVSTAYGDVAVKVCTANGLRRCYPEYEDVARISRETGVPFREVYEEASAVSRSIRFRWRASQSRHVDSDCGSQGRMSSAPDDGIDSDIDVPIRVRSRQEVASPPPPHPSCHWYRECNG